MQGAIQPRQQHDFIQSYSAEVIYTANFVIGVDHFGTERLEQVHNGGFEGIFIISVTAHLTPHPYLEAFHPQIVLSTIQDGSIAAAQFPIYK